MGDTYSAFVVGLMGHYSNTRGINHRAAQRATAKDVCQERLFEVLETISLFAFYANFQHIYTENYVYDL